LSEIDVRPIDLSPAGVERTCELLNAVFPTASHIDTAYLDRLFNGNPLGPTHGFSAWENDELVGHYLMIPVKSKVFGKEELGIWPFQLATHPGFRGKGLFSALAEASFAASREQGYGFMTGVANAQSSPIFVRKWGFQLVCQLDVKIGVGPIPDRKPRDDVQFTRVWDQPEGISWRLGHAPAGYMMKTRGGRGHLFADSGKYRLPVEIGDYPLDMLPEGLPPLRSPNPLRMWIGVDCERDWSGRPYFDLPERLKPVPLNLLFWDLTDQGREFDADKVQYDAFDFDAY